jgi:hypothetical protein
VKKWLGAMVASLGLLSPAVACDYPATVVAVNTAPVVTECVAPVVVQKVVSPVNYHGVSAVVAGHAAVVTGHVAQAVVTHPVVAVRQRVVAVNHQAAPVVAVRSSRVRSGSRVQSVSVNAQRGAAVRVNAPGVRVRVR